jgi:PAS domain S-box-containing protein
LGAYVSAPSTENWQALRRQARALVLHAGCVTEALRVHWASAREAELNRCLLDDVQFDALLRAEHEIAALFDADSSRRSAAQARLASAYAQKTREVDALLDSLPAIAFLKDSAGRYVTANRHFCFALGIAVERLATLCDSDLFPPDVAERFQLRDREVLEGRTTVRHEETFEQNGERITYLIIKAPVFDAEDKACGLIGVGFDLTKRKKIESEHARLAAAIDAAGDGVMIASGDDGIQYVNPSFERLTGRSAAEVLGASPELLGARYASEQAEAEARQAMADGILWQGFVMHLRKNGETFESDETIAPIRDASGDVTGRVYVLRDISERRRMVETMEQAVMVKSEFTNMVSHELRTPLTAIKESILVVADKTAGPLNERQDYFLKIAARNLERLHRLIDDTLDFSKIERGEFRIAIQPADINALVRDIVHHQRLAANKNGVRLEMSLDPAIGQVPVDSDRICQVLVNLIGNAVRYCERGWIEVTTTKVGCEALVKVQDTGPGIPADKLDTIFDAFVQLSTGDKRRTGGTGLGLAITRQIVEMHGGSIWVESEVDRGSAFYFSLPVESMEEDARR